MPFRSSSCPPPGQQDQGVRLAAPATVGQVGGTSCASLHAPGQVSGQFRAGQLGAIRGACTVTTPTFWSRVAPLCLAVALGYGGVLLLVNAWHGLVRLVYP